VSARRPSRRALIAGDAVALLLVAALAALGTWQIHRRSWKLDLIARVEARVHAAPVPLPPRAQWPDMNAAADEYRRVSVSGAFLGDRATLVQAVTDLGAGFWVMTPLRLADGSIVVVNRGFVPPDRRDAASWRAETDSTTVTGLVRMSEPGGGFLRANDPASDRWYSRDVEAIAARRGLADVAPFFIDAEKTPGQAGYPVTGLTIIAFSNNHLVYALTWYGLALMVLSFAIYGTIDSIRRRDAAPD
jgi:surfeit locus 1 family protein